MSSWARWAPRVTQSGGKRKGKNATGQGNPYFGAACGEAAISAGRTQTFPGARHGRLCKRMPKKKAQVATGRSLITIWYHLLSDPDATYHDLGADYYANGGSTLAPDGRTLRSVAEPRDCVD